MVRNNARDAIEVKSTRLTACRPQLREDLLLQPTKYLPDKFADQFARNVRFLWSGSLLDVAMLNPVTGMYDLSSSFNNNFFDENCCWTLCHDFFITYPELVGMIPIYNPT